MAAKKFWPPARARRKGGVGGEFRRARAFRRSEAEAVSSLQKMFEQSCIIPPSEPILNETDAALPAPQTRRLISYFALRNTPPRKSFD